MAWLEKGKGKEKKKAGDRPSIMAFAKAESSHIVASSGLRVSDLR